MEETFPDVSSMSDQELKELIDQLTDEERQISYKRRLLHGKIDILRAELVNRLKAHREAGEELISGQDVQQLTDILLGKVPGAAERRGGDSGGARVVALHCSECGFVNPEGANYCQKCGAYLAGRRARTPRRWPTRWGRPASMSRSTSPTRSTRPARPWLIRSGGGRAGESFTVEGERVSIGRTPDAAVFLDDVTVSRNHALIVRRRDGLYIDDLGSLNGTYVNRRRIESHKLEDGDEIQVGKYKLSYLER